MSLLSVFLIVLFLKVIGNEGSRKKWKRYGGAARSQEAAVRHETSCRLVLFARSLDSEKQGLESNTDCDVYGLASPQRINSLRPVSFQRITFHTHTIFINAFNTSINPRNHIQIIVMVVVVINLLVDV